MNQAPSSICCLFAVVDRGKGEAVSAELRRRRILTQLVLLGHGTASAEVMDLLGLDEPEKDVVLALLPGDAGEVLAALTDRLELYRPGRGIAFTIGLCSISALAHQRIAAAAAAETPSQKEERPMRSQHELIVVIAEHGFAADVMDAARAAGARGGTVVRGRSLAAEEAQKFLHITIQPEKDVVLILVPAAGRQPVMKAICAEGAGAGHALAFSLPVSDVTGLSLAPFGAAEQKEEEHEEQ